MAAPSAGQPVRVTVGVMWTVQVRRPPHRPARLPVEVTIAAVVLCLLRAVFGAVYFNDCPQQPNIPKYLLGLTFTHLLIILFTTSHSENEAAHPNGCKVCLMCLLGLSGFLWILAGDVWVFSVYQPNYDRAAADGVYCDKTLYTFAFWNAVFETFVICMTLANLCKGLMCWMIMNPGLANRDFYRNI